MTADSEAQCKDRGSPISHFQIPGESRGLPIKTSGGLNASLSSWAVADRSDYETAQAFVSWPVLLSALLDS